MEEVMYLSDLVCGMWLWIVAETHKKRMEKLETLKVIY